MTGRIAAPARFTQALVEIRGHAGTAVRPAVVVALEAIIDGAAGMAHRDAKPTAGRRRGVSTDSASL